MPGCSAGPTDRRVSLSMRFLMIVLMSLLLGSITLPAQESTGTAADSTEFYRHKYRSKKTWEHVVSAPGTLVSLPLVLFFKLNEALVGYIYDSKIIPKTKDFFTSHDEMRGIYPVYSNRSGGGLKFYQKGIFNPESKLSLTASGNLRERQRYRFEWKRIRLLDPLLFRMRLRYRYLPDEAFYGVGPDSRKEDLASFDHEYTMAEAGFDLDLTRKLSLFSIFRYDYNNAYNGDEQRPIRDLYDKTTLPGLQSRVKIAQVQAGLALDSRNRLGNPNAGNELILSGSLFRDTDGDRFNFWKIEGDLTHYLHFGYNRVLAIRVAGALTEAEDGASVPFYFLSELGERESIRGFDRGRFRDLDMFLGSLEYRIPIWHSIDSFFFADAGQVANDIFKDLSGKDLQFGFGGGIRFYNTKDLVAVLQVAASKERFRIYFNLN